MSIMKGSVVLGISYTGLCSTSLRVSTVYAFILGNVYGAAFNARMTTTQYKCQIKY